MKFRDTVTVVIAALITVALVAAPSSKADDWHQNCYKEGNSSYACHYEGDYGGGGYTVHCDYSGDCFTTDY